MMPEDIDFLKPNGLPMASTGSPISGSATHACNGFNPVSISSKAISCRGSSPISLASNSSFSSLPELTLILIAS